MFYDNYIRLCNSVNKTPSAVAVEIGISKPSVNRWKNGSYPTDATMQKIANYFGVTTEELKNGGIKENTALVDGAEEGYSGEQKNPTPENGSGRDYSDLELMEAVMRANEQQKEAIRLFLKMK